MRVKREITGIYEFSVISRPGDPRAISDCRAISRAMYEKTYVCETVAKMISVWAISGRSREIIAGRSPGDPGKLPEITNSRMPL